MNKRLFLLFTFNLFSLVGFFSPTRCLLDGIFANAQELIAKSCELNPDNDYAMKYPKEWDDEQCAVLIIKTPNIEDLTFRQSQHVGEVKYKDGNYYLYMVNTAYKLSIYHKDYQPLELDMKESFGIRVRSGKTYELVLDKVGSTNKSGICVAQFKISPILTGTVTFDGISKDISSNGIVEFEHGQGSFAYKVHVENYRDEIGTMELQQGTEAKNVRLRPITTEVDVLCNVDNAKVYVDNVEYGKPGKVLLPLGQHTISVRASKYKDKDEVVDIQKTTTQLLFNLTKNMGKTIEINPTPITIHSTSKRLFKNNKKIKGWRSGEAVLFMPGVKCTLSDDDDNHCSFTAGDTPKSYNFIDGRMVEIAPADSMSGETSPNIVSFTVNGVSFDMIRVEAGTFMMGSESRNESPVHQVTLTSNYYIGKYVVTQALWEAVMGKNPSDKKGGNLPVENVSWNKCQNFIDKLNRITGKNFRLPTEAEWEYAAHGGKKSKGYQYSGSDNLSDVAWYKQNSNGRTHPVGTKQPNELGIYDMSGNVWEWCQDRYDRYNNSAQTNPKGPSWINQSAYYNHGHVLRGGDWNTHEFNCYFTRRIDSDGNNYWDDFTFGLRLCLFD